MNQRPIKVAIVGCGLIGAQWDAAQSSPSFSLTHAAAFSRHPGASLVAVCDADRAKAENAARRWHAQRAYTDARQLFADVAIEVAVVAASSAARRQVMEPALAAGVKVLVIEKPLATTVAESRSLTAAIEAAAVKSVVNFSRHWDPSMRDLRDAIRVGELGPIQRLVGTYGKGITNNGSHMLDLVGYLCGAKPMRARSLEGPLGAREASWSDGNDPTLDAQVVYADRTHAEFHLTMLGTDQEAFTCFDLRVIGRRALYEMSRGGRALTLTPIEADPNYAGYRIPGTARSLPARGLEAMDRMADEALQLAAGSLRQASCDARSALQTALTVDAVMRSSRANGAWMDIENVQALDQGAS